MMRGWWGMAWGLGSLLFTFACGELAYRLRKGKSGVQMIQKTRLNPWPNYPRLLIHPDTESVAKYCEGEPRTPPHCDSRVLHAPGDCPYCDNYPGWQDIRILQSIAFTGHSPDDFQGPCPSDYHRGLGGAHVWPGNTPEGYDFGFDDRGKDRVSGDV